MEQPNNWQKLLIKPKSGLQTPSSVHLMAQLEATDLTTSEGLELLKQNRISYIYIGQREGSVWNPGAPLLSADILVDAPYYEPVYHDDRVWIFRVHNGLAEEG